MTRVPGGDESWTVDLYDTSRCPELPRYAKCGGCAEQNPDLVMTAVDTRCGVACFTLCPTCADTLTAADFIPDPAAVEEHARHLGVEPDVDVSFLPPHDSPRYHL